MSALTRSLARGTCFQVFAEGEGAGLIVTTAYDHFEAAEIAVADRSIPEKALVKVYRVSPGAVDGHLKLVAEKQFRVGKAGAPYEVSPHEEMIDEYQEVRRAEQEAAANGN